MNQSIPISLAVEDDLSENVLRRVLKQRPIEYTVRAVFKKGGFGYLKKKARAFNDASKHCPFLMLTDLDRSPCPSQLIRDWLREVSPNPGFLFRIAVREVESWLLGDTLGFIKFLGLRKKMIIPNPEELEDPKRQLLKYAIACPRRDLRDALVWKDRKNGTLLQGPDYNGALAKFVLGGWDIEAARAKCRSLDNLFAALDRFEKETAIDVFGNAAESAILQ